MKIKFAALLVASFVAMGSLAHASSVGYTDYVTDSYSGTGTWALWDTFPVSGTFNATYNQGVSFVNRAGEAGTSGATFSYSYLSGTSAGLTSVDGEGTANSSLYTRGRATNFTFSGSAGTAFDTLALQIKQNIDFGMGVTPGLEGNGFWTPKIYINGLLSSAEPITLNHTSTFVDGTESYAITYFEFEDLGVQAGDNISVQIAYPASNSEYAHQNIDGFRVDFGGTALVPEPSTYALMAAGAGLIIFSLRRRAKVIPAQS